MYGKWHLGESEKTWPYNQGFDETLVPLSIWALATTKPLGATVLIICTVPLVLIDTFQKPMLPCWTYCWRQPVVWGMVGLFVGAVILVLCWGALEFWIKEDTALATESAKSSQWR